MFDKFIDEKKNEIVEEVSSLIKIPSVSEETENEEQPFGKECEKALKYVLTIGEKVGFKTKNLDGYCG